MKTIYSQEHKILVKKLIKAREDANLRQEDVAKLLGKTQSFISKLESGQRRIDLVQIKEFANIYKKPASFFFSS
jgi:transcriptional regulator with XRE-family HTH domain